MRPRGVIRHVLGEALARLVAERGAVTCRQLAEHTQVGYDAARETLNNMRRAGEVVKVGRARDGAAGEVHWQGLYEPAAVPDDDVPQPWGGIELLASAMHAIASSTPSDT